VAILGPGEHARHAARIDSALATRAALVLSAIASGWRWFFAKEQRGPSAQFPQTRHFRHPGEEVVVHAESTSALTVRVNPLR
jgi:hypothetical protein